MVKRLKVLIAVLFFSLFFVNMVSAEAWLVKEPSSIYSFGDNLELTAKLSETGKQLEARLNCQNESKIIFFQYISNSTSIEIVYPLTKTLLGEFKGECKVNLKYGEDEIASQYFLISDVIFLNTELKDRYFEPGKDVEIKGRAEKANGQLLEGFYEINIPEINFSKGGNVENGIFSANISLPENMKAGNYLMNINAYQKNEGEIINKGEEKLSIKIKQIPSKIDIALDNQNVKPGTNLSFKIMLYDQSGEKIEGEASYLIENSDSVALLKSLSKIDVQEMFFPEKNLTIGYYKIKAYSSGLSTERQFYVEENEEAEFKIMNSALIIKNVGNVPYKKAVQVSIGGTVEIINHELALGEEKEYQLIAPKGTYSIKITDGASSIESESAGLITGRAIAIRAVQPGFFARGKIFAWVFLILVLGIFVFLASRRTIKGKFVLNDRLFGKVTKEEKKDKTIKASELAITPRRDAKIAEHSLVLNGQKQDSAVICLKIKNQLDGMAKLNIEGILGPAYDKKATIYRSGDYIIPIFSPAMTRTFQNHIPAVKTAMEIQKKIEEHNQKYKDKIEYGLSVHHGNLVSKIHNDKLMFTSVENTIATAKRIADISEGEILLSKAMHEKTIAEVKAEQEKKNGIEVFRVKQVVDREKNTSFIQGFLKRQEEGKMKNSQ